MSANFLGHADTEKAGNGKSERSMTFLETL